MSDQEQQDKQGWLPAVRRAIQKFRSAFSNLIKALTPNIAAWRWAGVGILLFGFAALVVLAVDVFLPVGWGYFVGALVVLPLAFFLAMALISLVLRWLMRLPERFFIMAGVGFLLTLVAFGMFALPGAVMGLVVIVLGGLIGAGVYALFFGGWRQLPSLRRAVSLIGLTLGVFGSVAVVVWLLWPGQPVVVDESLTASSESSDWDRALADPAAQGPYLVETLTYGSGTDRRRSAFGEDAAVITPTVNGSAFVDDWSSLRTSIWGFNEIHLPLNGRVWLPVGEGPFPLVLVVHGNHLAEDYSDEGYGYLCDQLASQGLICVSVDENFLNGSAVADFLGFKGLADENDLRGWLLLEHLSLWRDWASEGTLPFAQRVDLGRIALIGHSRGGEAVAIAAAFNHLPAYPDNARIKFDYRFAIQSVVAIAPVDRQYQPASEPIPLENVNYLTLQGSHDMDVTSFDGLNAYERVVFTDDDFHIKAGVHIWGANHGQFNTRWGNQDVNAPAILLRNRGALLSGANQQRAAQVFIGAFLRATLLEERAYLALFQQAIPTSLWLDELEVRTVYADSQMETILSFEEDIDVTTATLAGAKITGHKLLTWQEDRVPSRWQSMQSNSAVLLAWDKKGANYVLTFPESGFSLHPDDQLVFSAAQAPGEDEIPLDFSIVLVDQKGETASLTVGELAPLAPARPVSICKLDMLDDLPQAEPVFQTYLMDVDRFLARNPALNPSQLRQLQFMFDQSDEGKLWLDNVSLRHREVYVD